MNPGRKLACVLFAFAAAATMSAAAETSPAAPHSHTLTHLPWQLRDVYRFNIGRHELVVAVETGVWRLLMEGQGAIIDDASFNITMADGSVLNPSVLGKAATERNQLEDEFGRATNFWLEFPSRGSVVVRKNIIMYSTRPFMSLRLSIANNSLEPIEISKITQMVPGPSGITNFGPDVEAAARRLRMRGGYPVFDRSADPLLTVWHDKTNAWALALGVLASGAGAAKTDFKTAGAGTFHGEISCTFDPPIRVEPGSTFLADPLWLSFSLPDPSKVDLYYSWCLAQQPHAPIPAGAAMSWVTAGPGCSETDLAAAAQEWARAQVKHVLVPYGWEGRPGSFEGAVPRFSRSMDKAAEKIRQAGASPGLTVDPLLTNESNPSFTATTADGRRWINLSLPEGRQRAVDTMRRVAGWGFDFYAIHPSDIPDEALRHFAMSRTQADRLAFDVMAEAAAGRAVFPTAAPVSLKPALDDWLEAAGASSRMADFRLPPGPVRFDVTGVGELDAALLAAMSFFRGPIEFMGRPSAAVARQLVELTTKPRLAARPLDFAGSSPRIWQIPTMSQVNQVGSCVAAFPGAGSFDLARVEVEPGEQVLVWSFADGRFVDSGQPVVPLGADLTIFGVTPATDYPALMGASYGFGLLLNDVRDLMWDQQNALLSGVFQGSNSSTATAYVAVPEGWVLEGGRVDGATVNRGATSRVQFPVAPGRSTRFSLQFSRQ